MTLEQRKQILYEIGDLRYKNYDSQAYFDKQHRKRFRTKRIY